MLSRIVQMVADAARVPPSREWLTAFQAGLFLCDTFYRGCCFRDLVCLGPAGS